MDENDERLTFFELLFRYPGLYPVISQSSQIPGNHEHTRNQPTHEPLPWATYKRPTLSDVVFGDLYAAPNSTSRQVEVTRGSELPSKLSGSGTLATEEINAFFNGFFNYTEPNEAVASSHDSTDTNMSPMDACEPPQSNEIQEDISSSISQVEYLTQQILDLENVDTSHMFPPPPDPSLRMAQKYEEHLQRLGELEIEVAQIKESIIDLFSNEPARDVATHSSQSTFF